MPVVDERSCQPSDVGQIGLNQANYVGGTTGIPQALKTKRSITIAPCLNGYMVQVGCKTLVFESLARMCDEIESYYNDPIAVEKGYLTKYKD